MDIDYAGIMERVKLISENCRKASEKYNRPPAPILVEKEQDIRSKISYILMNRIHENPQIFCRK